MQRTTRLKRIRPLQTWGRGVTGAPPAWMLVVGFRLLSGMVRVRLPSAPLIRFDWPWPARSSVVRAVSL
jgi:hypothetical protein